VGYGALHAHALSWARLVRKSVGAGDCFEGLAEVGGQWVGDGDGVVAGLDLDGAVAAGGADELADGPARLCPDAATAGQSGEPDRTVSFGRVRWWCWTRLGGCSPEHCRSAGANVAHGLGHVLIGAAVGVWLAAAGKLP
jgi:hypothetical protein